MNRVIYRVSLILTAAGFIVISVNQTGFIYARILYMTYVIPEPEM